MGWFNHQLDRPLVQNFMPCTQMAPWFRLQSWHFWLWCLRPVLTSHGPFPRRNSQTLGTPERGFPVGNCGNVSGWADSDDNSEYKMGLIYWRVYELVGPSAVFPLPFSDFVEIQHRYKLVHHLVIFWPFRFFSCWEGLCLKVDTMTRGGFKIKQCSAEASEVLSMRWGIGFA